MKSKIKKFIGNVIGSIICIGIGYYILHKSFDCWGLRKYNKDSIWGEDERQNKRN